MLMASDAYLPSSFLNEDMDSLLSSPFFLPKNDEIIHHYDVLFHHSWHGSSGSIYALQSKGEMPLSPINSYSSWASHLYILARGFT
jgi:hypothetical protein